GAARSGGTSWNDIVLRTMGSDRRFGPLGLLGFLFFVSPLRLLRGGGVGCARVWYFSLEGANNGVVVEQSRSKDRQPEQRPCEPRRTGPHGHVNFGDEIALLVSRGAAVGRRAAREGRTLERNRRAGRIHGKRLRGGRHLRAWHNGLHG